MQDPIRMRFGNPSLNEKLWMRIIYTDTGPCLYVFVCMSVLQGGEICLVFGSVTGKVVRN